MQKKSVRIKKTNKILAIVLLIAAVILILFLIIAYLISSSIEPPERVINDTEENITDIEVNETDIETPTTNQTTNETDDGGDGGGGGGGGGDGGCTPNCAGKECGGDGCAGSCGTCNAGYECSEGLCVSAGCENDVGCTSEKIFCQENVPYNCTLVDGCLRRTNLTECTSAQICVNNSGCEDIVNCTTDAKCADLDSDYCESTTAIHNEGTCSEGQCDVNVTIIEDCNDGAWCNGIETCDLGICIAGNAPDCDDLVDCTDDSCNEQEDRCDNVLNDANCPAGETCTLEGCVGICTDTCNNLGYECGTQIICEVQVSCGTCGIGETCVGGSCVGSSGEIYYVDATNGDDSNGGGSEGNAWKTLGKVSSSSFNPGDVILLKRGEIWRESLIVPSSGDETGYITFGAYGSGERPVLDGQGTAAYVLSFSSKRYFIMENLEIQNGGQNIIYGTGSSTNIIFRNLKVHGSDNKGIFIAGESQDSPSEYITIENSEIYDIGDWGKSSSCDICFSRGTRRCIIRNNSIHGNGATRGVDGILISSVGGAGFIIENNEFYGHDENCIDFKQHFQTNNEGRTIFKGNICRNEKNSGVVIHFGTREVDILYNEIYGNGNYGVSSSNQVIFTPYDGQEGDITIAYNIIRDNSLSGIRDGGTGDAHTQGDFRVFNNVVVRNGQGTAHRGIMFGSPDWEVRNNVVFENGRGTEDYQIYAGEPAQEGLIISNNLLMNPDFVDYANNDFHLQESSEAIDAGFDVGYSHDLDYNPIVGVPDIGAYEYQGLPSLSFWDWVKNLFKW